MPVLTCIKNANKNEGLMKKFIIVYYVHKKLTFVNISFELTMLQATS